MAIPSDNAASRKRKNQKNQSATRLQSARASRRRLRTGRKSSKMHRRFAAIAYAQKLADQENPCTSEKVRAVLRGIRRKVEIAPVQKAPARAAEIALLIDCFFKGNQKIKAARRSAG
jgi:hypothetical protein